MAENRDKVAEICSSTIFVDQREENEFYAHVVKTGSKKEKRKGITSGAS